MTTSDRAAYVVCIDGEQHRRPAKNPYVSMLKIKNDIRDYFELDYDFDLLYKGSKISESSSLHDMCLDDCTPLIVKRKYFENEVRKPKRSSSLPRQTSLARKIPKVSSLNNLLEENSDDETELRIKNSTVSNQEYYGTPRTIIYISPSKSVDEPQIHISVQTSVSNPTSARGKLPSFAELPDETIDEDHSDTVSTPPFSSNVQPVYPGGLSINIDSPPTGRHPTLPKISLPKNNSSNKRNRIDSIGIDENLLHTSDNCYPNDSFSSSRSDSPTLSSAVHTSLSRQNSFSPSMNIRIVTLNSTYLIQLPTDATLKYLHNRMKQELGQNRQLENYSNRTHTLLFFNSRMHIFKSFDIDNETISTFLSLKSHCHRNNDDSPDFFVYSLNRKLSRTMYVHETDLLELFSNSASWEYHSYVKQSSLAQSTLLSTLYVLYQYFRRPPLNEKASRKALELQFLLYLRKYLFPPAYQALKHLLIRQIFQFEKVLLIDGLLKLLSELLPTSIEKHLIGIYTPHLFCWLFEKSGNEMERHDGFHRYDLVRFSNYINDPVTIHDHNHDPNILYEYDEVKSYRNLIRNIDLYSLIKYLQNSSYSQTYEVDRYTIDMCGCLTLQSINRANKREISTLEQTMARVYRSFTILISNVIENSHVRDQLILLDNKQVGVCFKRRQQINSDLQYDQELDCFIPTDPSCEGVVTLDISKIFEVEQSRPDPHIPRSLQSNFCTESEPRISSSPTEQITLILLDISYSMFKKGSDNSKRFIDISINILKLLCENFHRQSRPHATGLVLFGKDVIIHCPITRDIYDLERQIYEIPKTGQAWTSMYDAINTGIDHIHQYELKHSVSSDCQKLIICITDGIDNGRKLTIDNIKQRIRRTKVVIDLIFLSSNTIRSYKQQERQSITALRSLCSNTGGTIYRNASMEPIDLATTFEQEAVLWIKARKERKKFDRDIGTAMDWPLPQDPEKLYQTAFRIQILQHRMNSLRHRPEGFQRLHDEINNLIRKPIDNIHVYIGTEKDGHMDYNFWKVIIQGPSNSLYAKGYWLLYIIFPEDYPILPPIIRFHTPIFHLNISADGRISHDLFDIGWSTVITMAEIFDTLNQLLTKPDIRNPISKEYLSFYDHHYHKYESRVYKHCQQYAMKKIDQFKNTYRLKDT